MVHTFCIALYLMLWYRLKINGLTLKLILVKTKLPI